MSGSSDFVDFILEMLNGIGGIRARAMFGGHGIFHKGLMVGLIADDVLYLKVDDLNRSMFEQADSQPFRYLRKNRKEPIEMSYWEVPMHLFDDVETLHQWTLLAHKAAIRSKRK